MIITPSQQSYLLALARRAIAGDLGIDTIAPVPPAEPFAERCGAFVTLRIRGALRGCIGTMTSDLPLPKLIEDMARSSAFSDPRFPPLRKSEFASIEIELSLLSPLVRVKSIDEIVPGTHGIYLTSSTRTGVLLPQVAVEYGWDRITFLEHTCRKAGLPPEAYRDPDVALYVFSAVLCSEQQS